VSQTYIVDAITPVRAAKRRRIPDAGRKGPSRERKNQMTPRGRRKEKSVWPTALPLLKRSTQSFAARAGCGKRESRPVRGVSRSAWRFARAAGSGRVRATERAAGTATRMQAARSVPHEKERKSAGGRKRVRPARRAATATAARRTKTAAVAYTHLRAHETLR